MNRNHNNWLFAFLVCLVAALVGCGNGSDAPQNIVQPPLVDADSGTDQNVVPDTIMTDGGNDVHNDKECPDKIGGPCSVPDQVSLCAPLVCNGCTYKWIDPDSGVVSAPCMPDAGHDTATPEASTDADAAQPQEVCNGLDDDGDGNPDNGFECVSGKSVDCWTTCGSLGKITCDATTCKWSECKAPAEICDNWSDEDCDSKFDCQDPDCASAPNCQCQPPAIGSGCVYPGEFSCEPSVRCNCNLLWGHASEPNYACIVTEVCNGQDDNGNGAKDETFACTQNVPEHCLTSCGTLGLRPCNSNCQPGNCAPPIEDCLNGIDDNCDGKIDCQDPTCSQVVSCVQDVCDGQDNNNNGLADEGYECVYGQPLPPCVSTCGTSGHQTCSPVTCTKSACIADAEICGDHVDNDCNGKSDCEDPACSGLAQCQGELCDGVDNNNNGVPDETFECVSDTEVDCTSSCGTAGKKHCSKTYCVWGACVPFAEICGDSKDNDCNGKTDCEDPVCKTLPACNAPPECTTEPPKDCTTTCGSTGKSTCDPAKHVWGPCVPLVEACGDGNDNDCNGLTDCLDQACAGQTQCAAEVCDGADNNNNGQADETFQCKLGDKVDCPLWCGGTGEKTCVQGCTWGACVARAEICDDNIDNDCNGLVDCNDPACNGHAHCTAEVCDGADNNNNGQADETFQCRKGAEADCPTTCGSTGKKVCGSACTWESCQPKAEVCGDGQDNDCNGAKDCWDSACASTPECQHDFGTCQPHTPTGQPTVCGAFNQDVMPDGMYQVKDGCANGTNDQWVVGGTYNEGRVRHLTGGTTWANVAMPLTTKVAMGVACQGATNTFVTAIEEYAPYKYNGVLLRWNGSALVRVAEAQTHDVEFGPVWAASASSVMIYGRTDYGVLDGAYIYMWDGNSMSRQKLPQLYAPNTFHAAKVWGSSPNDVYLAGTTFDPNDRGNAAKYHGGLMHYDGKSWGKVTIPAEVSFLLGIHGTSSCDVMVTGDKVVGSTSVGITLQRNGSSWTYKTYPELTYVQSVAKTGPFKYVLQGQKEASKEVWMGTDQGNFNVTWNRNFSYLATGSSFWHGGATWNVPGTNMVMTAGDGKHDSGDPSGYGEYAHVFRSTCQ